MATIHSTPTADECITCTRTLCDLPHTCGKADNPAIIIDDTDLTREELCRLLVMGTSYRSSTHVTEHRHPGGSTFRTLGSTWLAGGFNLTSHSRREAWAWEVCVEVKDASQWRYGHPRVVTTKRGLSSTSEGAEAEVKRWRKRLASEHRASVENATDTQISHTA